MEQNSRILRFHDENHDAIALKLKKVGFQGMEINIISTREH